MTHLLGFGHHLPEGVLDNATLAEAFGWSEEEIFALCGMRERRVCAAEETVVDLAHHAALNALNQAGLAPSELGGILVGSGTPHRQFPGISASLQARLGIPGIPAFDIHLASVGGFFALATATDLCHRYGPMLVVGAEHMSAVMARTPRIRETAILFGDGAGACVVAPGSGSIEVMDIRMASDATFADALSMEFGAPLNMDGRTVILQANRKLKEALTQVLKQANLQASDVGLWLFHQANVNLLKQVAKGLGIPEDRVFLNLERYGNTSSASLLIALSEAHAEGRLQPGYLGLAAFGAGMSWGAGLLRVG